ncbi:MAG: Crp/Fnr family transcriptional regulator [Oscillospiraceae bacterium]|nr:Crp/Fnr family transcriptional regulator [Oscillospiraceae bacterium]
MEKYLKILINCPLFACISESELPGMLGCLGARITPVVRGESIFTEGEPAQYVGLVLEGGVQVVREDFYGNRSVMTHIGPGGLFGEVFACAGMKTLPVSVVAESRGQVMLLNCSRILKTCSSACDFHTKLVANLLQVMAEKNQFLNQKIEFLSKRTTRQKLLAFLMAQAKRCGSDTFVIPYDRQALADFLGVDRSAMSAEISRMKAEGLIDTHRSRFKLLSPPENIRK